MKTFEQLNTKQQQAAIDHSRTDLLQDILDGAIRFNDKLNKDDLQARINAAFEESERMQTPWFASEYVMDTCREEIEGMARCSAEDSIYPEPGEHCISNIA